MTKTVHEHEGKKYLRVISSSLSKTFIFVDVYDVLEAFEVHCPARAQAIKKLLCAGQRDKGGELEDLVGAEAAISRAIELQQQREASMASGEDMVDVEKEWEDKEGVRDINDFHVECIREVVREWDGEDPAELLAMILVRWGADESLLEEINSKMRVWWAEKKSCEGGVISNKPRHPRTTEFTKEGEQTERFE